jgi:hypothetical protein
MEIIGGVVSLLPIIELLTTINKYTNTIEQDALCHNAVNEFIELFCGVMSYNKNLIAAQHYKFFYCLSLFIEQLPNEYLHNAFEGFKQISFSCENSNVPELAKEFYQYILFNTTLLMKLDYKTLNQLWEHLKKIDDKLDLCFTLSNWCDLLLTYDSVKKTGYK